MSQPFAFGLVWLTILFTVFGQLIIKYKAGQMGRLPPDWAGRLEYILELFFSPFVIVGVMAGGIAAICWIFAMTRLPISVAYPFVALTFPLIVFGGYFLFGEQVNAFRLAGVALICGGVILVNYS